VAATNFGVISYFITLNIGLLSYRLQREASL
jgi:hypothetical protein